MRYFWILMVFLLATFAIACDNRPPLPFGVTEHTCPVGSSFETRDNYSKFAGVDGTGYKDAVSAYCVTSDRFMKGWEVVYDTATGKKLLERKRTYDGKVEQETYWAHNAVTRAFRKEACGGIKVRWPAGHWATFHMPCADGKKASEQYCFASPKDVRLPTTI